MAGLNNILFSYDFEINKWNISYYADAVSSYDEGVKQYKVFSIDNLKLVIT